MQSKADKEDPLTPIIDQIPSPSHYNEYLEGVTEDTPPQPPGYEVSTDGNNQVGTPQLALKAEVEAKLTHNCTK